MLFQPVQQQVLQVLHQSIFNLKSNRVHLSGGREIFLRFFSKCAKKNKPKKAFGSTKGTKTHEI